MKSLILGISGIVLFSGVSQGISTEKVYSDTKSIDQAINGIYISNNDPGDTIINDSGDMIPDDNIYIPQIIQDFYLPGCYITQGEQGHIQKGHGSMYATDIGCGGKEFDVLMPSIWDRGQITKIGTDIYLGNYVVIGLGNEKIVLGHTITDKKVGEYIYKGEKLGHTMKSGKATGPHLHIEKRYNDANYEYSDYKYKTPNYKSINILSQRGRDNYMYFTHYDLGNTGQNDGAPCNGASGKDLCSMEKVGIKTMALTSDIRKSMGIKFGDKVKLVGSKGCAGIYQVEDEMNKRFRTKCIYRPGTNYCIKGDLPSMPGGACKVSKIK